ncbi:MAG: hypothetical protein JSS04_11305 [Proteobacteria bacterium]|nr:hypothetical protein [Pseudomonadota bacterium]
MASSENGLHKLKEKGIEEFHRFTVMFLYLWAVFGVFVLNQAVALGQTNSHFITQGFAVINAAVLAKVMLIAEDLKLGRRLEHLPLIYPVLYKSGAFAVVFIVFHVLEKMVVGLIAGKSVAASMPSIGGGTWFGIATVWAIMAASLLPFFALREISRIMGKGELWNIMFRRPAQDLRSAAERKWGHH